MKSRHQSGSAHVVIIVVLVALIVGALGFVFWNNFMRPKVDNPVASSEGTNSEEASAELKQTPDLTADGYTVSIKYPSTWSYEDVDDGDLNTITSPDGELVVRYSLQTPPVFGMSAPDKVVLDQLEWSELVGYTKAKFVSIVLHNKDGQYGYVLGLEGSSREVEKMKAGDTVYDFSGILMLSTKPIVILSVGALFQDVPKSSSLQDIQKLLASDNAKVAQTIIESVVVTKK